MTENDTKSGQSARGIEQILGSIRDGQRADITTPTGKQWEVYYELSEFVILESAGYTISGEQARERLNDVLRKKGTECSLSGGESGR